MSNYMEVRDKLRQDAEFVWMSINSIKRNKITPDAIQLYKEALSQADMSGKPCLSSDMEIIAEMVWEELHKLEQHIIEFIHPEFKLDIVDGFCGPYRHSWVEVIAPAVYVADTRDQRMIIDPVAHGLNPQNILITPDSPFQLMYTRHS